MHAAATGELIMCAALSLWNRYMRKGHQSINVKSAQGPVLVAAKGHKPFWLYSLWESFVAIFGTVCDSLSRHRGAHACCRRYEI